MADETNRGQEETVEGLKRQLKKLNRQLAIQDKKIDRYADFVETRTKITAMISAEQARKEGILRMIMESSQNFIFILDKEFNVTYCAESYLKRTNKTLDDVEGYHIHDALMGFTDDSFIEKLDEQIDEAIEKGYSLLPERAFDFSHNGETDVFNGSISALHNREGELDGLLMFMFDVTALIRARDEATLANNAKSEFLANMSHEIRTPMNAVIGMTAIAKGSNDPEKKDDCLDKIEDASMHLLGVINDVLDMSKIAANKLELSVVDFSFEKMLRQVVNVINMSVEARQQQFVVQHDSNIPPTLKGDDQRLSQVIVNLLSNAVKFTSEGGSIKLDATLLSKEDNICTIQFSITDTGIGISEEQQKKLFSAFTQAEVNTTRNYGGTGLGLALSKSIVELMQGSIWIESELGEGSTFYFTIKVEESDELPGQKPSESQDYSNLRVLIVDDTSIALEYFESIAGEFGFVCDLVPNAEEALGLIEKGKSYDIHFIDVNLPGMNGLELTQHIRSKDNDARVIIISAYESSLFEEKAVEAGANLYLQKPLFASDISRALEQFYKEDDEVQENSAPQNADDFSSHTILLVEDVEINREIIYAILEPYGLQIEEAVNGQEAVDIVAANPGRYSLVFMDIQMPVMDGYNATRAIRALQIEEAKSLPIVAMTANVFREDIEASQAAGMNNHIGKPINLDQILAILREYLNN